MKGSSSSVSGQFNFLGEVAGQPFQDRRMAVLSEFVCPHEPHQEIQKSKRLLQFLWSRLENTYQARSVPIMAGMGQSSSDPRRSQIVLEHNPWPRRFLPGAVRY